VKPGHWQTVSQDMRANLRDFVGDSRLSIVDSQNRAFPVANTRFTLRSSRPVLLTKSRLKKTETTLFIPEATQSIQLSSDLEERSIGFGPAQPRTPLTAMPSYQYHFVVLAKEPGQYGYLRTLDSVKVPFGGESDSDDTQDPVFYSVVPLAVNESIALPDNPLTWSSIAYILWDEVNPGDPISPDQKKALVDWIHWGGQLIISGPDSLDLLRGSFLDAYLPATSGGAWKIEQNDPAIAALNEHWMISTAKAPGEPLKLAAPWSAIKLVPAAGAKELPNTGGLFVERQIGRGRIVVSAMQLSERDLINWRSGFESMFNACLLRRPPREFLQGHYGELTCTWADGNLKKRRLDAALNSSLRYFARDLGVETAYHHVDVPGQPNFQFRGGRYVPANPDSNKEYRAPDHAGGVGAWNDFCATADAARGALREAAGVEVPGADFVVLCLAGYLVALVPVNWLIFRAIGRVEWAWIAAPVIALAGTWIIVQRAQLDIGFVRAQTEIGILEQQPEHPRAHLSRYTALYTSLSTTYDLQSDNGTTLIAPFPADLHFQMLIGQGLVPVNFQRYDDVRLTGLPISSNSTGMVHSEEMHALDGPIRLVTSPDANEFQVQNGSKLALHSACLVRKPTAKEAREKSRLFEGHWIGELGAGQSAPVSERMTSLDSERSAFDADRVTENRRETGRLNLEPMLRLALDPKNIDDGETRLVARVDEVLPGQAITPEASQVRGAALVVAHLKYADPPAPRRDVNTRRDIKATDDPAEEPTDFFEQTPAAK
jgi:hypothetical protein